LGKLGFCDGYYANWTAICCGLGNNYFFIIERAL
jgi:hypothetical protein